MTNDQKEVIGMAMFEAMDNLTNSEKIQLLTGLTVSIIAAGASEQATGDRMEFLAMGVNFAVDMLVKAGGDCAVKVMEGAE